MNQRVERKITYLRRNLRTPASRPAPKTSIPQVVGSGTAAGGRMSPGAFIGWSRGPRWPSTLGAIGSRLAAKAEALAKMMAAKIAIRAKRGNVFLFISDPGLIPDQAYPNRVQFRDWGKFGGQSQSFLYGFCKQFRDETVGERKRLACGLSCPRDCQLWRRWHLVVLTSDR